MDLAPTLPPSQGAVPVIVANATDFPVSGHLASDKSEKPASVLISRSTPLEPMVVNPAAVVSDRSTFVSTALTSGFKALDFKVLDNVSNPSGFLESFQLTKSFRFVGQTFRDAKLGGVIGRPQYSTAVPINWARGNDWSSRAKTADIQVTLVDATSQVATMENNAWAASMAAQCTPNDDRHLQDGSRYRLSMGEKVLGYVADEDRAYLLAKQLQRLVHQADFEADEIAPYPAKDSFIPATFRKRADKPEWSVGSAKRPLFAIDESMSEDVGYSKEWAAVAWANNLRLALDSEPLSMGEAQMGLKNMEPSDIAIDGDASWYGPYFHGRATANGETYDQYDFTVAHKSLPFGTHLKVRNLLNDKTVVVRVNDRGPYVGDRTLDLSRAAADCLGSDDIGVIPYEAIVLKEIKSRR